MKLSPELVGLARQQHGVLSFAQLRAGGATTEALRWNVGRHWRLLLPAVVLLAPGRPTRRQREVAALLYAGPRGILGGLSAARWHGIEAADPGELVHVLVPPPLRSRIVTWVRVRRTTIADPRALVLGPVRVCSPARAILDAAAESGSAEVAAAIGIEGVQKGLVTLDDLGQALFQRNNRGLELPKEAVRAAASGAWSPPERILLEALRRSPLLPEPWPNPVLFGTRGQALLSPDLWLDDVALAILVHSRRFHSKGSDWDTTVERDGGLTEEGVVVAGVTPHRIVRDIEAVVRRIERTYLSASRRPRPAVRAERRRFFTAS